MEWLFSLFAGMGLSAACGFRVFVPMLFMGVASRTGHLALGPGFEWMGSTTAIAAFGAATALEVGGYLVPWLDNLLDTVATPAALIAGTVATASMVGDINPFLKWSLGVVAGGGVAGVVQGGTVLTRAAFSATTGGVGNPAVSVGEDAASVAASIIAIAVPILAVVAVVVLCTLILRAVLRRRSRRQTNQTGMQSTASGVGR